ncbi:MAG: hypothetical protein IKC65_09580 [Lentisphaeria bacterium]|nr:hypothetical protein [Lentisphaeria bacterium]
MRKWRFTRRVSGKETALLAFLAAAAVHALFLLPGYKISDRGQTRKTPGVQILNMGTLSSGEYRQLKNWIAVHDPARVSRSSSSSGYMALLPGQKHFSVPLEPFEEEIHRTIPSVRRFTALPVSSLPAAAAPEPEEKLPANTLPLRTVIFDHRGNRVDMPLVLPPGAGSRKATVVRLRKAGKVFIASQGMSSGNPVLDRIARNAALAWHAPEETTLTFLWPQEGKK